MGIRLITTNKIKKGGIYDTDKCKEWITKDGQIEKQTEPTRQNKKRQVTKIHGTLKLSKTWQPENSRRNTGGIKTSGDRDARGDQWNFSCRIDGIRSVAAKRNLYLFLPGQLRPRGNCVVSDRYFYVLEYTEYLRI